ncbi:MAG: HlyC/CorC family transporter [Rhizobiales bacterium]|nr:HlyC/CorC family transporter [Hyphomicrobiales bacterium]
MSTQPPSGSGRARRPGLWHLIKQRFGPGRDSSFQESLQNVIETHAASGGESQIADEARSMMLNIIEFADMRVEDVMVPRADIVALEETATIRTLLETFIEANHSRVPIYHETLDDINGFIHVKDFLRWMAQRSSQKKRAGKTTTAKPAAPGFSLTGGELSLAIKQAGLTRDLLFVPPSMPAPDLLIKMQASHIHLAIVVDEYGGTDGLVSIEDLVEEIVGDISDEHDTDERLVRGGEYGVYTADGRVDIEELEKLLKVDLLPEEREEDADTLGGLIFSMAGRVPVRGELIRHPSGIEFEIVDSDPRRVKRVRIHTQVKSEPQAAMPAETPVEVPPPTPDIVSERDPEKKE